MGMVARPPGIALAAADKELGAHRGAGPGKPDREPRHRLGPLFPADHRSGGGERQGRALRADGRGRVRAVDCLRQPRQSAAGPPPDGSGRSPSGPRWGPAGTAGPPAPHRECPAVGAGGAAGLVLAYAAVMVASNPVNLPRMDTVALDGRVLLFTGGITILLAALRPGAGDPGGSAGAARDAQGRSPGPRMAAPGSGPPWWYRRWRWRSCCSSGPASCSRASGAGSRSIRDSRPSGCSPWASRCPTPLRHAGAAGGVLRSAPARIAALPGSRRWAATSRCP